MGFIKVHTIPSNMVYAWTMILSARRRFLLLSAQNTSMDQNTNSIKTMWRNTRCLASQGKLFKLNDLM